MMVMLKKLNIFLVLSSVLLISGCISVEIEKWPPSDISECKDFQDVADGDFNHIKRNCYLYFFRDSTDINDCALVSDPTLILECTFSVAVNTNSINLCNQISDLPSKDICLQRVYDSLIVIAKENYDPSICEQMDGFSNANGPMYYGQRNECFYEVAVTHNSPEFC
jgi:hypothetical protein